MNRIHVNPDDPKTEMLTLSVDKFEILLGAGDAFFQFTVVDQDGNDKTNEATFLANDKVVENPFTPTEIRTYSVYAKVGRS